MKFLKTALSTLTILTLVACGGGGGASPDGGTAGVASGTPAGTDSGVADAAQNQVPVVSTIPQITPGLVIAADVADKYSGAWTLCFADSPSTYVKRTLAFTKHSATSAKYTLREDRFALNTCSGLPTAAGIYNQAGTVTFTGTKVVGTNTVDKISIDVSTPSISTQKNIGFVTGNQLKLGDLNSTKDPGGYPAVLDMLFSYDHQ
jgi:hypothetical protein